MFLLLSESLFSIGFGYHVFDVKAEAEFGSGIFPASAYYRFDFPMPDLIKGNDTVLSFSIDNGLEYRTLRQSPYNGELIDEFPENYRDLKIRDYSALFDEFNLLFEQGFFAKPYQDGDDLVDLHVSLGGRFELAFERLSWLRDPDSIAGVFWLSPSIPRFPDAPWIGSPELRGDRMSVETFITLGLKFSTMREDEYKKNGFKAALFFRYSPSWFPLNGPTSDFLILHLKGEGSCVLYDVKEKREGLSWFTLTLSSEYLYRFIYGSKVPYYAMETDMFNMWAPSAENLFYNRLSLNMYGPQMYFKDLYVYISLFHEFAYSFGPVLNNILSDSINEIVALMGMKAEFVIFDFMRAFFEVGYAYKRPFNEGASIIEANFGVSLGF